MNFIAELKRRNVIRMAGVYLVGAWLVTQVAGTILPMFGAPEWVARTVVILLAIGFIPALVISWAFQLTPEGLKRDDEVSQTQSIAPKTAQRLDRILLVVVTLALACFAFDKFILAPTRVATAPAAITGSPTEPAADEAKAIVLGIAVLPFDNLSPDPDNAFFAGGVYEEVLTKLSRMGELRIISRTSMERIAEDKLKVGEIGARLGVSHVLEGSVRRAGDQIRVTVQLIEAASDNHVWAENYDRKLDDVFAIQSEIALAIADQLKLTLSPELEVNLSERPTQNQAAYALYLRALEERRIWRVADGFKASIDLLEPAVAADPSFLEAQVLLADSYGRMAWIAWHGVDDADPDGSYEAKARQRVADIVQRWPDHPQSQVARGQLAYNLDRDYAQALKHFEAARVSLPNDVPLLSSISGSFKRLRRNEEFLSTVRALVALDPESPSPLAELGLALIRTQRLDEAVETMSAARTRFPSDGPLAERWVAAKLARDQDIAAVKAIDPGIADFRFWRDIIDFLEGDTAALLRPVDLSAPPYAQIVGTAARAELLQLAGRDAEASVQTERARALLATNEGSSSESNDRNRAFRLAITARVLALSGETDRAREHIAQALAIEPSEDQYIFRRQLAYAERNLGQVEAAWLLIQPFADDGYDLSHGELKAFKAYYDQVYGESPSYREYMAKIPSARDE